MTRREPLVVANCSGFYGDRISAAREMVEGGPIDVLTGDFLAELTMYVLHKTRSRGGFASTFVSQMESVLALCLEQGIKVVSNAGGLDPKGCAEAVREIARRQGLEVKVASVSGDDLTDRFASLRAEGERFIHLDTGEAMPVDSEVVTASAYLGGAPIAAALSAGADVVVTGRVTDASLVVGPGIWAFGWCPDDLDAVAGAVVAGHVIECGAQCVGGNYAFFEEVKGIERCGFPFVELSSDGSAVVGKHPGTGGTISLGTITAQLLYEIGGPRYLSPDAVARFDSIHLAPDGPDRVRISGVRGEPAPATLKVAANLAGGWRNAMTLVLTGTQIEEKARVAEAAVWAAIQGGAGAFDETAVQLVGERDGHGVAMLRLAVRSEDERLAGRAFSSAVVETTLASYPGTYFTSAPSSAQEVARYWPTTVDARNVSALVELDGEAVSCSPWVPSTALGEFGPGASAPASLWGTSELVEAPLGILVGARSGDKGGNANLGLWVESDEAYEWLAATLDAKTLSSLVDGADGLAVERYEFANLRALNFVIKGLLGWGVASNLRLDTQAKSLGEEVRAQVIGLPAHLLASGGPAERLARWRADSKS
jgi:hypothetical protein